MTNGHFFSALGRLKLELGLKTDKEIQELLGIPQSTFSRSKKDPFPAEWAFKIELKYGITTRWIMTGQGPKWDRNRRCETFLCIRKMKRTEFGIQFFPVCKMKEE